MKLFCGLIFLTTMASTAFAQPVTLDVEFKLTELDYRPIPNALVRLIFTSDGDWQNAAAGRRFTTDAKGEAKLTANAVLDKRLKKMPTNFWSSLVSTRQETDHLVVGAELEYMEFRWLYTVEVFRFREGTDMLGELAIYSRDERGNFTRKAERKGTDWVISDLRGMVLTTAGYDPWNFSLSPEPDGKRWQLKLAFKKFPPPQRR